MTGDKKITISLQPARISQNTKEGTGNINLEVESWEIVTMLVSNGIVIKGKKWQVELWGQPPKPQTKPTGSFHTPINPPAERPNATRKAHQTPSQRDIRCFKYGKGGHMQYQCPDLGMEHCDICGARGHLTKDGRTTQRRLALGMRGGAAQKGQNPPQRRPNALRNPPNTPNAHKNAPTAPQALRNAENTLGPATRGKGKGTVDPTAKMIQFSMVEGTKPSQNRDWEAESSTEVKW